MTMHILDTLRGVPGLRLALIGIATIATIATTATFTPDIQNVLLAVVMACNLARDALRSALTPPMRQQ